MNSLRRRLLLWFLVLSLIGWAITIVVIWYQVSDEIEEIYDAQLIQTANELADVIPPLLGERASADKLPHLDRVLGALSHPSGGNAYAATPSARIWRHGRPLHGSDSQQTPPGARTDSEVETVEREGQHLRRYVRYDATHDLLVEVTEVHTARSRIIDEFALASTLPLLALLPLLGFVSWLTTSRGPGPLRNIVRRIKQRSPEDLQTLPLDDAPEEIRPLLEALNQLFERVSRTMEREQWFTGDASHELRTPLATLRIQAQLAQRTRDPQQREYALQQLLTGIDRSTHVVEQLLALARMRADQSRYTLQAVQILPLLQEQAEQHTAAAQQKSIRLSVASQDRTICADEDALRILLRNLVDNAIRYTPEGGEVHIACGTDGDAPFLTVADSGPGIPAEQREQALGRFHRGDNPRESGCGLGPSIVQSVVGMHKARLELGQSALGGLQVTIRFPAAV